MKWLLLPRMTDSIITSLIGANISKAHWVIDQRRTCSNQPYAIKGLLGWVILGPMSSTTKTNEESKVNRIFSNKIIHYSFKQMFDNEYTDTVSTRRAMSEIDKEALNYMTSLMCLVNGHYQIDKGYAEIVPRQEQNKIGENVCYLPHTGVLKHQYASKLGMVFDGAAIYKGMSLKTTKHWI